MSRRNWATLQTSIGILRSAPYPMRVNDIVAVAEAQGVVWPTQSRKPKNVIMRDLAMSAKFGRLVRRVAPGLYEVAE